MANKQDLPNALSVSAICANNLNLPAIRNRDWFIQGICAITGDGLYEGLDWAISAIEQRAGVGAFGPCFGKPMFN